LDVGRYAEGAPSLDLTILIRMNSRFFSLALFASLPVAVSLAAEASNADALKERIIAHARTVTPEDYAYMRTIRSESTEGNKKEERVVVDRWDPTKPQDQRWTLVSINGQPPSAEQLKSYAKETPKRRAVHYGRVADYFGNPATSATDARGRTVFRLAALPKDTVVAMGSDISGNATGELVVDTSGGTLFIDEVRFVSTKSTRVKLIAVIERFEAVNRYRMMPNGKPVPVESSSEMNGSMMGKQGIIRTKVTYSDHRAVGK
jgi:hypothetical protein